MVGSLTSTKGQPPWARRVSLCLCIRSRQERSRDGGQTGILYGRLANKEASVQGGLAEVLSSRSGGLWP